MAVREEEIHMVKKIFAKAFVLTALVFSMIFLVTYWIETQRVLEVKEMLTEIDNLWNDARLLTEFSESLGNVSCEKLVRENYELGGRIYREGLRIEAYEKANRLTPELLTEKKRYALLDLQFWLNSIKIKKMCDADYATVIYFYSQFNKSVEQKIMDSVLWDFKQKCGPRTIYITFPVDMEISSINAVMELYNITRVPAVVINESVVLYGVVSIPELEKYVNCTW
ncbi:MAG: thioredoxin family protein [Candidatus Micrarchaeota archaeon]|nr:thioredoxin family protein [Candidatus Micrarchaeota archaeon]